MLMVPLSLALNTLRELTLHFDTENPRLKMEILCHATPGGTAASKMTHFGPKDKMISLDTLVATKEQVAWLRDGP